MALYRVKISGAQPSANQTMVQRQYYHLQPPIIARWHGDFFGLTQRTSQFINILVIIQVICVLHLFI